MATFEADGQTRTETVGNDNVGDYGRTMSTRATFIGERLTVSSQGNRATDFVVTFEPLQSGTRLVVTRSYYTRVSTTPRWDLYESDDPRTTGTTYDPRYGNPDNRNNRPAFLVPDGSRTRAAGISTCRLAPR